VSAAVATFDEQLPSRSLSRVALHRFVRRPGAILAFVILLSVFALGLVAPWLAGGWDIIDLANVKSAPSTHHLFGTDSIGRDVLKRTLYGVRTTAEIALGGAAIATVIGLLFGAFAGYFGGWLDAGVMRLADLLTAYPAVVLTLATIVYLAPVYPSTMIWVYGGFMWVLVARAIRAEVVRLRDTEYVEAARALGASNVRILGRHLLPNVLGTLVVAATSVAGLIVLVDATVEFFGYGFPAEVAPSLGNLIADTVKFSFGLSNDVAAQNYGWWGWFFPGVVLVLILVCINVVGDALDQALNPRSVT
jgi:peptide/nickel transport system permease protein